MKRAVSGVICLILSVIMIIPAFAAGVELKLDGRDTNNEWYQYNNTFVRLLNSESSSNRIESAGVKYAFDSSQSAVWFFFSFNCKGAPEDMSLAGIKFCVEGSEEITLQMGESEEVQAELINDDYNINLYMTLQRDKSVICEIKAVVKNGLDSAVSYSAVFIDNEGASSVRSSKVIVSRETTAATTEKTTKATTTKSTTKRNDNTTVSTERSTRERTSYSSRTTTKVETTTVTQAVESTTRIKTTKEKTTKEKTTRTKTEASNAYQPEYISSDTDLITSASADVSATVNETDGASITIAYKIAATLGAAVLFAVVGVWAVRNHKDASEADKEEKSEKAEENTDDK